ncbi:MAG: hypothetical protein H6581_11510 [Bacteroidia bacterium]|nr:hypothetical protein [Bacteroidia bacterium]
MKSTVTDLKTSHANLDDPFFYQGEENVPQVYQQETQISETPVKDKPVKRHSWAFFLASMFLGVGVTATTEVPLGVFVGMGLGFLFFVPTIYDRVLGIIGGKKYREEQKYLS